MVRIFSSFVVVQQCLWIEEDSLRIGVVGLLVVEIEPTSASVLIALKKVGVLTLKELSDRVSLRLAIIVKCFGSLLYDSISYSRCGKILIAKPCRTACRTDSQSADSLSVRPARHDSLSAASLTRTSKCVHGPLEYFSHPTVSS